jgi:hypothetical protein
MKYSLIKTVILSQFIIINVLGQTFITGEQLEYKVHYGILEAGRAYMEVSEPNSSQYKFTATGKSTGLFNIFFKVRDLYYSVVDKACFCPVYFHRDVKEGKYKKIEDVVFNYNDNRIESTRDTITILENSMDIVTSFYHLRTIELDSLYVGYSIPLCVYLDDALIESEIHYLGNETIKSKFGNIHCQVWSPVLEAGRIFKDKYGMKIWVSDDQNRIPIQLKTEVLVGAIKMDLVSYKNLTRPLQILRD